LLSTSGITWITATSTGYSLTSSLINSDEIYTLSNDQILYSGSNNAITSQTFINPNDISYSIDGFLVSTNYHITTDDDYLAVTGSGYILNVPITRTWIQALAEGHIIWTTNQQPATNDIIKVAHVSQDPNDVTIQPTIDDIHLIPFAKYVFN